MADGLEIEPLDLADARSINAFASRFLASGRALSILINAVSTTATPWLQRDARGNETQLSVNHLGHFQLVARLWPALQRAQGARIVSVFNRHRLSPIDFDDVNFERRRYDQRIAHGQSKTANLLFAVALDARGERYGIRALSLHAGTVLRPFARLLSTDVATSGVFDDEGNTIVVEKADLRTAAQSAATAVWCATSASLDGLGGLYCEDCGVAPVVTDDANERYGVKRWAVDPDLAERLWCVSQGLAGVRFPRNQGDVEHAR
jgi:NAD(P)-dependent dehydrogenase (short-subunit alcohol dehydrogenase family)